MSGFFYAQSFRSGTQAFSFLGTHYNVVAQILKTACKNHSRYLIFAAVPEHNDQLSRKPEGLDPSKA